MAVRLTSQLFLLGLTALMGGVFTLTLGQEMQEAWLAIATIALIGLSLALERLVPLHDDWNRDAGDTAGDIGSFVVVFGLVENALKYVSPFLILAVLPEIGMAAAWPLWVQIVAATLLIELGAWVSHWAHHTYRPLWALHAMHHSTRRLYTLNNFRFHPFNHVINYLVMFLPLLALGISAEAILGYTALALPVLILQHSNVGFRFGALSYLLNTNTLHRWHHSTALKEGMHNFGRAFVIWDHVFGTYYNPAEDAQPGAVGLSTREVYPQSNRTLKQLAWPFSKECCGGAG